MHFEEIRTWEHPMYRRAMDLYRNSFPWHEQREEASQRRILAFADYHFTLVWDGETFVGAALFWETEEMLFLEHLCVLPDLRNRRYGERILTALKERGKTMVLEADPPADPISRRRMGFYARCGFRENSGIRHVQMPFHAGEEPCPLILLSWPEPLTRAAYDRLDRYLKERVMKDAFASGVEGTDTVRPIRS